MQVTLKYQLFKGGNSGGDEVGQSLNEVRQPEWLTPEVVHRSS